MENNFGDYFQQPAKLLSFLLAHEFGIQYRWFFYHIRQSVTRTFLKFLNLLYNPQLWNKIFCVPHNSTNHVLLCYCVSRSLTAQISLLLRPLVWHHWNIQTFWKVLFSNFLPVCILENIGMYFFLNTWRIFEFCRLMTTAWTELLGK